MGRFTGALLFAAVLWIPGCQTTARRRPPAPAAPVSIAELPEAPTVAPPAAGPPPDPGQHCGEPPERIAAREGMARAMERREEMIVKLAERRSTFLRDIVKAVRDGRPERLPSMLASVARDIMAVTGGDGVNVSALPPILEEAAFLHGICAARAGGRSRCRRLDVLHPAGATLCTVALALADMGPRFREGADPEAVLA